MQTRKWKIRVAVLCLCMGVASTSPGGVVYVDADASGANDGSSWENAYFYLQDALMFAAAGDEIRVAQGVYRPDDFVLSDRPSLGRAETFQLINGVTLKGGYAGHGQPDPNSRDIALYETILSGDLDANDLDANDISLRDLLTDISRMDNSYHIITVGQMDEPTVLDGVTVECGHAEVVRTPWYGIPAEEGIEESGAGILCDGGILDCLNCTFQKNFAFVAGGAIDCNESTLILTQCTLAANSAEDGGAIGGGNCKITLEESVLVNNTAIYHGGAISTFHSDITFSNCELRDNSGHIGGGMYTQETSIEFNGCASTGNVSGGSGGVAFNRYAIDVTISDCLFFDNHSSGSAGCIYNAETSRWPTQFTVRNSSFVANSRGAIYNNGNSIRSEITESFFQNNRGTAVSGGSSVLTNCVFEKNYTTGSGGGVRTGSGYQELIGCVFIQNQASAGGGICCSSGAGADVTLTNCGFYGNKALEEGGGGTVAHTTPVEFYNCTFAGNQAPYGSALSRYHGYGYPEESIEISGSILRNGGNEIKTDANDRVLVTYSNLTGGWPGEGNIDVDPCFADSGYWDPNGTLENPDNDFFVLGDYHLKSQGGRYDPNTQIWIYDDVTSPCIDAGDPIDPIGPEPFPNGGIFNMGAYGGTGEASKSYFGGPPCEAIIAGDVNGDCRVNFKDFMIMALHWCEDNNP